MQLYGLIGFPLSHSFSQKYFTQKFRQEYISDARYELFELPDLSDFPSLLASQPALRGLNVTIPHKEKIIPYLTRLDASAERIGAVNVIKTEPDGSLTGYNSDYYGFRKALEPWLIRLPLHKALVLGTGGASKAVQVSLADLGIDFQLVSRQPQADIWTYEDLKTGFRDYQLIINTTPLGMYPAAENYPELPYTQAHAGQLFYDLVYNPETTLFLQKAMQSGAFTQGGLAMLHGQAEKAWQIWNS
jgi:shikimate dehydrogenase